MRPEPSVELFDRACDVLLAAQAMCCAAGARGDVREAVPATLGCLGESLDQLARSSEALAEACGDAFGELTRSLHDARDACEAARVRAVLAAS